jgi:cephalosporin hydroxylase
MDAHWEFARSLSDYLALYTEQSSGYLFHLIRSFLRGAPEFPRLEPAAKSEIVSRLKAEVARNKNIPSFFQHYLLTNLQQETYPPQAVFYGSRYLHRSKERFLPWSRRQQLFSELAGEAISGTELGFSQTLYSQGVGDVFRWRGIPCFKTVHDLAIYAMIISELRPSTIIELGSGIGGSALFFADVSTLMGLATQVISIDKEIGEVSDSRIDFVRSDCVVWLEAAAKSKREFRRPCLLVEDFHADLTSFFEHVDAILEDGDYLFIEDSHSKQRRIAEVVAGRPYVIDSKYTDFFGINCTSAMNSIFVKRTSSSIIPQWWRATPNVRFGVTATPLVLSAGVSNPKVLRGR